MVMMKLRKRNYKRDFQLVIDNHSMNAFRIGRYLGSLCAKAAIDESTTLLLRTTTMTTMTSIDDAMQMSVHDTTQFLIERHAILVSKFLRDEILIGRIEHNDIKQQEALLGYNKQK
jgi:hypothetical protein